MVLRHVRPPSIADAHVFGRRYHGKVEFVVQSADKRGSEWHHVVHVPFRSRQLFPLNGERISLHFNQLKQFFFKWPSCGKLYRSTSRAVNYRLQSNGICPERLADGTLTAAGNQYPRRNLVPMCNRESAARACAEPFYVSDVGARRAGALDNNELSEFQPSQVREICRRPISGAFGKQTSTGFGVSAHQGHTKSRLKGPAGASAMPLTHRNFAVSPGAIPSEHGEPPESHSWLNFGCSLNPQAPTRCAVAAAKISDLYNRLIATVAAAYPAARPPVFSAGFFGNSCQLSKTLAGKIDWFCHCDMRAAYAIPD